jgi:hypothetical protein
MGCGVWFVWQHIGMCSATGKVLARLREIAEQAMLVKAE